MANRFNDQYRPPHSGGSVFRPYEPTTSDKHQQEQMFPKTRPYKGGNISKSTENPYMDEGGSSVSRKPKTPSKSPSGGVALPIPQKVK
jgi:hypothetical protein